MNKLLCSILLLVSVCTLKAQNAYTEMPGRWRFGLNMGAIWQSSDVKPIPGLGGGFNLEKILNKRANAPIGFSLGFRYLGGRTFGLNTAPSWDVKDNKALNGTYDSTLRYDTVGYFYANHKTFIQEGALEFKINFPAFEQRTHLIFHLWGGVGIGKFKTWIDAKDQFGNMYDMSSLHAQTVNQSDLSRIYKGSYETLAEGSGTNGTIRFLPSAGVGVGVRLGRYTALVLEHKVSFPMTDYLDGFKYSGSGSCVNDWYHYTGVNLIFTLHASGSSSSSGNTHTDQTVYTNTTGTTVTTHTNTSVTNTVTTTPTETITVPKVYPPSVIITYPNNNYQSQYDNVAITAQLQNITSSQQIGITINGYPLQHFSFNPSNGHLNFQAFLAPGNNFFVVTGTNQAGTASDDVNVLYTPPTQTIVTTNTISTNPTNTVTINTNPTHTVSSNPTSTVTINTNPTHTVSSNPTSTVTINTNPTNTVVISPTNTTVVTPTVSPTNTVVITPTVSTTNTISVTHNPTITPTGTVAAGKPPVVNIINPSVNPYEENGDSYNVSGSILNITSASQISILVNKTPLTQFNYGLNNKMVSFWVQLGNGSNVITVSATNNYGTDTKTTIINHKPGKPPKVVISVPATSPFMTFNANNTVSGNVYFVGSASDIKVTANGSNVPFNYDPSNSSISVNLVLQAETTQVAITGQNKFGSDSQSTTLIKRQLGGTAVNADTAQHTNQDQQQTGLGQQHTKPQITVLTPPNDPFQTNNASVSVTANINFVLNSSDVWVEYNGAKVSSSYDVPTKKLNFTAPLVSGMNTFVISAHNHYGTTTKSVNVNCTPLNNNNNQQQQQQQSPGKTGGVIPVVINPNNGGGNNGGNINNGGNPGLNIPKGEPKITPGGGKPVNTTPQSTVTPNQPAPRTAPTYSVTPTTPNNNGGGGRTINTGGGGGR